MSFIGCTIISQIIASGKIIDLLTLLIIVASTIYFVNRAEKGQWRKIRSIPAINYMDELVGRAAEMGMSMHYSPGDFATLQGSVAPQTLAGLNIMQHLARVCARNDVKLIATTGKTDVYPLMETMVREAYVGEGNPLGFKIDDTVRFTSNDQQSDSAFLIDLYKREKVAGTVLIGAYGGGTLSVLGGAHMANSIIIFGTARTTNLAFGAGLSDAVLLGEEIYAAGALVSRDPVMLGSISGEEIGKWLSVALIILGAALSVGGLHVHLANLLKL